MWNEELLHQEIQSQGFLHCLNIVKSPSPSFGISNYLHIPFSLCEYEFENRLMGWTNTTHFN